MPTPRENSVLDRQYTIWVHWVLVQVRAEGWGHLVINEGVVILSPQWLENPNWNEPATKKVSKNFWKDCRKFIKKLLKLNKTK